MSSSKATPVEPEQLRAELNHIYDDYRKALMNRNYYAQRLATVSRLNWIYEATLALGASGTIAGWQIFQSGPGRGAWALFAGLVAILVTLKPFFQLPEKIKQLSALHAGYQDLFFDLKQSVQEIAENRTVTASARLTMDTANKRFQTLAREDEKSHSKKLLRKCYDDANIQIPVSRLWYPKVRQG
jgi:hypothetical protein